MIVLVEDTSIEEEWRRNGESMNRNKGEIHNRSSMAN
jgi:hypothetical protein